VRLAGQILGTALLSGTVAAVAAILYRWYVHERVPRGAAVLAGLSAVALLLNTTAAFGQVLVGSGDPLSMEAVVFNTATFVLAGVAAPVGRFIGDRIAVDTVAFAGAAEVDAEVGRLVRTVGRVTTVELPAEPDEVADMEGYEPVEEATKAALAGKTLLFPRRLTVGELREQFVTRLKAEYDVGHVDVEIQPDGVVSYLAVGRRATGLGHSLPPGSAAVAVVADPPPSASPGDLVQVWETGGADSTGDPDEASKRAIESGDGVGVSDSGVNVSDPGVSVSDPRRVTTAEVRATAGDVVTLVVDAGIAPEIAGGSYRLVTLPAEPRPDREFARLLHAASATMAPVSIHPESEAAGSTVGELPAAVVVLSPASGSLVPLPEANRPLEAGDTVYVIGQPDAIRRVEELATVPADESVEESVEDR
jgi:hypothetical protein